MAISKPQKNTSGDWVVTIAQDGAQASRTLLTKNNYVDGDIILNQNAATQIVFGNQPASGKQASSYTTIDDEAPVLISGDYLYVNEGYRGNVKISLSKLVPDGSDVAGHGDYILKGHSAYDNAGTLVAGTIETRTPSTTYYTSSDTGYGRIDIGYIANAVSIKAGNLNPTATIATQSTAITGASTIDKQYVKITPKDIPTTAGWVTKDGVTGTVLNYKVKDGSATPNATLAGATGLTDVTDVNSKQFTVTPTATVGTAGWISSIANGTVQNYEVISATTSGTGAVSSSSTNVTLTESSTVPSSGFYITSTGSGTVTVETDGWISGTASGGSATKYYSIPTSALDATASSANIATIAKPSTGTEGTDYFSFAATATSGEGYTGSDGSTDSDKKYVAKATITNNTTLPSGKSSSGTINRGSYIKIAAGYNKTDLYYQAQANSGNVSITQQSGQSVNGYATASVRSGAATPVADLTGATGLTDVTDVNSKQFTVTPKATVSTAGWIASISNGAAQKYEVISASLSGEGSVSSSSTNINLTESATAPSSGYYFTSTGGGTVKVSQAGWIQSNTSGGSATKYYSIPSSSVGVTESTTMATITKPSTGTDGTDYFSATGTGTAGEGYIGSDGSTDTKKVYIAKAAITNNTTLPSGKSSSGTINRGNYIKIGAGYNKTDLYYLAQANSGSVTINQQSGQSVDGYATASVKTGSAKVNNDTITPSLKGEVKTAQSIYLVTAYGTATVTGSAPTAGWISSVASGTVTMSNEFTIPLYTGDTSPAA